MKTHIISFVAIAAIFASCAKENQSTATVGQELTFTAKAAGSETKTILQEDGTSLWWAPGDAINIFYGSSSGGKFIAQNTEPSALASFSGTLNVATGTIETGNASKDFWAVYPYSSSRVCDDSSVTITVPATQQPAPNTFPNDIFPSVAKSSSLDLAFYNVCGGLKFSVFNKDIKSITFKATGNQVIAGDVKVGFGEDGKPVVKQVVNGVSEITITPSEGQFFQAGKDYYIVMLPAVLTEGFTMSYTRSSLKWVYEKNTSVSVKRSNFGMLSQQDKNICFDLSSNGTANCYIVPSTGKYKFNASVKGNSSESVGTPSSAEVLWESFGTNVAPKVGEIIKTASILDGFVSFETPETLANGNAVIAVKDASGTILWSWHIWVCEGFDSVATQQVYANNAGIMMDRNLGATSEDKGKVSTLGLLYQWGRKDPFLGSSSLTENTIAAASKTIPNKQNASEIISNNTSLNYSINYPTTYICNINYPYDWYCINDSNRNDELWGDSGFKSIYDPCPNGWRVAKGGYEGVYVTAGFPNGSYGTYTYDSTNYGMSFGALYSTPDAWYPIAASYDVDGTLFQAAQFGYWWTRTANDFYARCFAIHYNGSVYNDFSSEYYRAKGRSVRCCKE